MAFWLRNSVSATQGFLVSWFLLKLYPGFGIQPLVEREAAPRRPPYFRATTRTW